MMTIEPGDLLWGAQAIADYIQRPVRTAYYLIGRGVLPVTKMGPKTIVARRSDIDRAISGDISATSQIERTAGRAHRLASPLHSEASRKLGGASIPRRQAHVADVLISVEPKTSP